MLLYIHIPFCIKKCAYCDFLSVPADGEKVSLYVKSLIEDIKQSSEEYKGHNIKPDGQNDHPNEKIENDQWIKKNETDQPGEEIENSGQRFENTENGSKIKIETIYIGGGTPSFIDAAHISEILSAVKSCYDVSPDAEITIEVNPCSATKEKLNAYKEAGVNRISMGVQSFDNDALKTLGRVHNAETAIKAFSMIRHEGFTNVNLDLISCIPSEKAYNNGKSFGTSAEKKELSAEDWKHMFIKTENGYIVMSDVNSFEASLEIVKILNPEHISVYQLIIEEGTPFYEKFGPDSGYVRNEDEEAEVYLKTAEFLKNAGYEHYEISNFSKPGYRSRHNCGYWQQKDYIGCGAGAVGCVNGVRYRKHTDIEEYIKNPHYISIEDRLTQDDMKKEYIMLGLRTIDGVSEDVYRQRFDCGFEAEIKNVLDKYIPEYVAFENGSYHFTEKGFLVSNSILSELL